MVLVIRQAQPEDADAMSRVLKASIIELCAADHGNQDFLIASWTRNKSSEALKAMLAEPELKCLVAQQGEIITAVGALSTRGQIVLNYVAPEFRFMGFSRAVLARMEAELRGLGFSVGALVSTRTAHRFYRDAGWVDSGDPETGFAVVGFPMRKVLYEASGLGEHPLSSDEGG
jgi:GNAT superfamily N-acetyltransferase